MRPGEKREIGIVNGWRYVVCRSDGASLFYVIRKSLSAADHGTRTEQVTVRDTEKEAEEAAQEHMQRVSRAVEAYDG